MAPSGSDAQSADDQLAGGASLAGWKRPGADSDVSSWARRVQPRRDVPSPPAQAAGTSQATVNTDDAAERQRVKFITKDGEYNKLAKNWVNVLRSMMEPLSPATRQPLLQILDGDMDDGVKALRTAGFGFAKNDMPGTAVWICLPYDLAETAKSAAGAAGFSFYYDANSLKNWIDIEDQDGSTVKVFRSHTAVAKMLVEIAGDAQLHVHLQRLGLGGPATQATAPPSGQQQQQDEQDELLTLLKPEYKEAADLKKTMEARDSNGFDLEGRLAMALKELRVTKDGLRWAQEPGLKLQESLADRLRKEDSALDAAMADVAALQARLKDAAKKLQQVQPELLQASRTIRSLSVMDGTAELIKENARRSLDTAQAVLTDAGSLLAALEGSGALRQVAVPYGLLAGLGQEAAQTAASNSQLADSYRQLAADLEAPVAAARIAAAAAAQANVAALEASLASVTANANAAASKAAEALAEMTDQRDAMVLQYNQLLPGVAGQQAALAAARAEAEVAVAAQAALTAERHALARENAELTTRCNAAAAKETAQAKAAADLTAERDSWKAKYDELAAKPAEQEARGTSPRHGLLQLKKQGRLATDLGLGQH